MGKSEKDREGFDQELDGLRDQMKIGGGQKRIDAQHEKGKKTARERIEQLIDKGSFQEINGLMKNRQTDFGKGFRFRYRKIGKRGRHDYA